MTFAAAVPLAAATGWQRWWVTFLRQPPGRGKHKHKHGRANCQESRRILNLCMCVCASSPCALLVCMCVCNRRQNSSTANQSRQICGESATQINPTTAAGEQSGELQIFKCLHMYACVCVCMRVCMFSQMLLLLRPAFSGIRSRT